MAEEPIPGPGPEAAASLVAEYLRQAGTMRRYPARTFIFHTDDEPSGALLIDHGLVRIDRTSAAGRVVLFDLAGGGRVIGELGALDGTPRSASASTIVDTVAYHVSAARFRHDLAADNALQGALLATVTSRLRELSNQFVQTSILHAPARVAARLLRLVELERAQGVLDRDDDGVIDLRLPISQEELGQWSGLTREGAVKGLSTLRSTGVIDTGRKRVTINDLAALAAHAASE